MHLLVLRLVDSACQLLAWVQVQTTARGDRCLWPVGQIVLPIEQTGEACLLIIHHPDLNVQSRVPVPATLVEAGSSLALTWDGPLLRFGSDDGPLPPVTVRRSMVVAPPTGALLARPTP